jgi:hypothetical protein
MTDVGVGCIGVEEGFSVNTGMDDAVQGVADSEMRRHGGSLLIGAD